MARKLRAADLFCGAGGFSHGAEQSGAVEIVFAVNHWPTAIETHKLNHPHCRHARARVASVHPSECGRVDILFFSTPCQGHSWGRGSKPTSENDRADPWDVVRWLDYLRPAEFVGENVMGFLRWGPVDKDGRPIKSGIRKFFDAWVMAIQAIGYRVEWRQVNSKNYGAATSRPRLIIRGSLRRAPRWPVETHPESHVPASTFIRFDRPGQSIAQRPRPLADNTLRRIACGREKFGHTFLVEYYGNSGAVSVDLPLPTITTRDRHGLVIGDTLRMLDVTELKMCQGFSPSYLFIGTDDEVKTQIGNSVSPPVSRGVSLAIAG